MVATAAASDRDTALIIGNLTAAEVVAVQDAVTAALAALPCGGGVQSIALAPATSPSPGAATLPPNHDPSRPATLTLAASMEGLCKQLHKAAALEHKLKKAMAAIGEYQKQQQRVVTDFGVLTQKYQATKATLQHVLWHHAPQLAEYGAIPQLDEGLEESEQRVGVYALGQLVGSGHFANVKEILGRTSEEDGRALVLKAIDKGHVKNMHTLLRVAHEIEALRQLRHHPNVIRLYNVLHGKHAVYLVTERLSTDLYDIIGEHPDGASGELAQRIITPVLSAIAYVHANGFVHRDIKPENILVTRSAAAAGSGGDDALLVKVCDFGLCCPMPPPGTLLTDFCGSPGFLCPEMVVEKRYDGVLADHFSIGCVLLELLLPAGDFSKVWMRTFEDEVMADGLEFKHRLRSAGAEVGAILAKKLEGSRDELLALATGLLQIDAFERYSTKEVRGFLGAVGALLPSCPDEPPSAALEGLALDAAVVRSNELERSRRCSPVPGGAGSRRAISPIPSPSREMALAATPVSPRTSSCSHDNKGKAGAEAPAVVSKRMMDAVASRPTGLVISSPKAVGRGGIHGVRSTLRAQALLGSDPAAPQRQRDKDALMLRPDSPGTPLAASLPPTELLLEGLGSPLVGTPLCSPTAAATGAGELGES